MLSTRRRDRFGSNDFHRIPDAKDATMSTYVNPREAEGTVTAESRHDDFDGVRRPAPVARVGVTEAAAELLIKMTKIHGPLMFHQSGGCCDGSAPMCFPRGEFNLSGADVHVGDLLVDGVAPISFHMSAAQFKYWSHTHLTVDVVPGRGSGFSVEAPEGARFIVRSRLLTDAELLALEPDSITDAAASASIHSRP